MMEKQRASRKAYNSQDAIERLSKHALNFSANKTRGGEIEVGESQHVALDAALFFFVERHDHEHGDERGGNSGGGLETDVAKERCGTKERESDSNDGPH